MFSLPLKNSKVRCTFFGIPANFLLVLFTTSFSRTVRPFYVVTTCLLWCPSSLIPARTFIPILSTFSDSVPAIALTPFPFLSHYLLLPLLISLRRSVLSAFICSKVRGRRVLIRAELSCYPRVPSRRGSEMR